MKLTNKNNFPDALVKALENDSYSKGDATFSITELLQPSRQWALKKTFEDVLTEDVEDRLYSLYGQVAHLILERANVADLAEKRFFAKIGGYMISGQIDSLSLEGGILTDWKFTTAWGFLANQPAKPEWIAQMNMQLELLRQNDMDAQSLQIVGLIRDYQKSQAKTNPNYPQSPVARQEIEVWPREKTIDFMIARIESHLKAMTSLPICSIEERWAKEDMWAVMKKGGKRAIKLYVSKQEAQDHATNEGGYIAERPGRSPRCEDYCQVSEHCTQYKQSLKGEE